jgi:hypothetical protein
MKKNSYETAQLDDEWIVLNTEQYTITKLNETGGFCWALLNERQTIESLFEAISEKFTPESEDAVRADIQCFLLELQEYGLIETYA